MRTTAPKRIHLVGAAGAGVSTLGRAVAERLHSTFLDTDDFYWAPTEPPYREPRTALERTQLLSSAVSRAERWVLAGSLCGWGDVFMPLFDVVVFVHAPQSVRIERIRQRERKRFGVVRLEPGGDLHDQHEAFIAWARAYDDGGLGVRSRRLHDDWLERLPPSCRVLRVDGTQPIAELLDLATGK
ncbi:MAG: hypothetical protein HYZ29_36100 [Myxococcales bacterium]|nr:hypothetical protein [Myxococcales bacterium]